MSLDNVIFAGAFIAAFAIPAALLLWKLNPNAVRHMLGIVVIRDQDDVAIRNAVSEACKGVDVKKLRIDIAEDLIEETARHAIAQHFSNASPGRTYVVTKDWPGAKCVIQGNIAVVRPILGLDYMNDHDGIRAVSFEVDRESNVLNLRPWAPKQPEPAPDGQPERPRRVANLAAKPSANGDRVERKTESKQPPKAVPRRANLPKR